MLYITHIIRRNFHFFRVSYRALCLKERLFHYYCYRDATKGVMLITVTNMRQRNDSYHRYWILWVTEIFMAVLELNRLPSTFAAISFATHRRSSLPPTEWANSRRSLSIFFFWIPAPINETGALSHVSIPRLPFSPLPVSTEVTLLIRSFALFLVFTVLHLQLIWVNAICPVFDRWWAKNK